MVECFRPIGPEELRLLQDNQFSAWPKRLLGQPFFYPVTNQEYAREITVKWNVPVSGVGYVTRFFVRKEFMDRYPEWWIPAEDLELLNQNLLGKIEVLSQHNP